MTSLTTGMITFFVGLIGYTAVMIASNLFHRWRKSYSFKILENENEVIVKRNPLTNSFSSVAHFFLYSLITFITAFTKNKDTAFIQLSVIYTACLLAVLFELYFRASFEIIIDKVAQTIRIKEEHYSLTEVEFEISDRSFYLTDNYDAYELRLKNLINGKTKRLYGYSTLWDIQELRSQLELRQNSRQHWLANTPAD